MISSYRRRKAVELLGSMRFAIALLTLLAIASVAGTILKQNEPQANYINQFGLFWAMLFDTLGLYNVYSAWWFLLVLFFLVASTLLCLVRNVPKIWGDMRHWKEQVQEGNLRALHYHADLHSPLARQQLVSVLCAALNPYRLRVKEQAHSSLILGRQGQVNKLGYIFAHSAIVIICVGALLDSDLLVRAQLWFGDKKPLITQEQGNLITDIPADSRLPAHNPSFRAHLFVPEGQQASAALLNMRDRLWVQDLPFTLKLERFTVDYYSSGMPRSFISEVSLTDHVSGKPIAAVIKVNQPFTYKGITIYQSSFDDGGSRLHLLGYPLQGAAYRPQKFEATVGSKQTLPNLSASSISSGSASASEAYTVEFTGLRAINVETIGVDGIEAETSDIDNGEVEKGRATAAESLSASADLNSKNKPLAQWRNYFGSAAKSHSEKKLRNIGPSIQYKLRDAAGQAYEFDNYMLPVMLNGVPVFLMGMRSTAGEPFRYLRIPADANGSVDEWITLRAALQDSNARGRAAERYAQRIRREASAALPDLSHKTGQRHAPFSAETRAQQAVLHKQLQASAERILEIFAGAAGAQGSKKEPSNGFNGATTKMGTGGYRAVAEMIEQTVPEKERARTAEILVQILHGSLFELWQIARAQNGVGGGGAPTHPLPVSTEVSETEVAFIQAAINALSDSFFYHAPVLLHLTAFDEVKASVFQLSRTPGKYIVYFGCLLLVLGVFAMFYIRERRLWILLKDQSDGTEIIIAYLASRKTIDCEQAFAALCSEVACQAQAPIQHPQSTTNRVPSTHV